MNFPSQTKTLNIYFSYSEVCIFFCLFKLLIWIFCSSSSLIGISSLLLLYIFSVSELHLRIQYCWFKLHIDSFYILYYTGGFAVSTLVCECCWHFIQFIFYFIFFTFKCEFELKIIKYKSFIHSDSEISLIFFLMFSTIKINHKNLLSTLLLSFSFNSFW